MPAIPPGISPVDSSADLTSQICSIFRFEGHEPRPLGDEYHWLGGGTTGKMAGSSHDETEKASVQGAAAEGVKPTGEDPDSTGGLY